MWEAGGAGIRATCLEAWGAERGTSLRCHLCAGGTEWRQGTRGEPRGHGGYSQTMTYGLCCAVGVAAEWTLVPPSGEGMGWTGVWAARALRRGAEVLLTEQCFICTQYRGRGRGRQGDEGHSIRDSKVLCRRMGWAEPSSVTGVGAEQAGAHGDSRCGRWATDISAEHRGGSRVPEL